MIILSDGTIQIIRLKPPTTMASSLQFGATGTTATGTFGSNLIALNTSAAVCILFAATAATAATTPYAAVLATLGVNQSDLSQKTKDTVVALQSYAQVA